MLNRAAPRPDAKDADDEAKAVANADYFGASFAYQVNLLVQYHGKQASQLVERLLSKNYEQG